MDGAKLNFAVRQFRNGPYKVNGHFHKCYEIVCYHRGSGETTIGDSQYKFSDNTFALIPPLVQHSECASDSVDLLYIGFEIDDEKAAIKQGVYTDSFGLRNDADEIITEQLERGPFFKRRLLLLTEAFGLKIERSLLSISSGETDSFEKAKTYIKANCLGKLTVQDVATTFSFSYDYFRYGFERKYGISPKAYITEQKIKASMEYLKNSSFSVSEIAMITGFSSSSHYISSFRQRTGLTPKQYSILYLKQTTKDPSHADSNPSDKSRI